MRFKNLYEITHEIRKNGWHRYIIHIEAYNKKEAIEKAKEYWYEAYKPHMFRIKTRKVPLDECIDMKHWFVRV